MPFSHHSHSGQFCNHASDRLEEVVQEAVRQKMQVFALTEHMPRNLEEDLYPGETEIGYDVSGQAKIFDAFYATARRLQGEYADRITLLVGMEVDWIRASSREWIEDLLRRYPLDLFVGSVHHVHGLPIDYSPEMYAKALATASPPSSAREAKDDALAAEDGLFVDYFDAQLEMLIALRPPVVGHFDLIRLLSSDPNRSLQDRTSVWQKILRNLEAVADYGGVLELNSSALRKGLKEPYPKLEICKAFLNLKGKFVLSDDSHGIKHIGHSYSDLLKHAAEAGIQHITVLRSGLPTKDIRFPNIGAMDVELSKIRSLEQREKDNDR